MKKAPTSTRRKQHSKDRPKPSNFGFQSSTSFARADYPREWLVEDILLSGQPGVIGGPPKSLKTGLLLDMAISLGAGRPFLDRFDVPQKRRVAVLSGESGAAAIQETAERICKSKQVELEQCRIFWKFELPRLSQEEDQVELAAFIRAAKIEVVFIDPLYLCLCAGGKPISPTNLYEVGPVLKGMADSCLAAGATPIFVHHKTKSASKTGKQTPSGLSDLAYAGISEFVRQWMLIDRRSEYDANTGVHQLRMTVGGSGGHSGAWDVEVREGSLRNDFSGRYWDVSWDDEEFGPVPPPRRSVREKLADFDEF